MLDMLADGELVLVTDMPNVMRNIAGGGKNERHQRLL